jgi:hypothetical protein
MELLARLFESGRITDLIFFGMFLEAVGLAVVRRRLNNGPPTLEWLLVLLAGAALIVSLGFALRGYDWRLIAGGLSVAGLAHLGHLWVRWIGYRDI